jgi:uncharacterized membrane protein YhaH (DUF805 family)
MRDLLYRFDPSGADFSWMVWSCLGVIWLAVLACAISSICSQPLSAKARRAWIAIVMALPLIGLALYLPVSFRIQRPAGLFALFSKQAGSARQAR